jgi:hypothetical protein
MKIYSETRLRDFAFWGKARKHANYLSYEQLDWLESALEDIRPQGMSDTQLNDLMWNGTDLIAEGLGFADFAELMNESCPFEVEGVR